MTPGHDPSEITCFIVNELGIENAGSIVARTAEKFALTRQGALYHIKRLIAEGALEATGKTRARRYSLKKNVLLSKTLDVLSDMSEDAVFRSEVAPLLEGAAKNVMAICAYAFTEMFNNVIDHSESSQALIELSRTPAVIEMGIHDLGVGIFKKIKESLKLDDERQSLLELSKGKMTTNPARHSGEGIFFTSRACDQFSILSGHLFFFHHANHDDWLFENRTSFLSGTSIVMRICAYSQTKLKDVFDKYSTPSRENDFARTHVPVSLAVYGEGNLISRSQAKRVLVRFDQFEEVLLDFEGVSSIGQAFADEIFRVFRLQNSAVRVLWIRANPEVESMIRRAQNAYDAGIRGSEPTPE